MQLSSIALLQGEEKPDPLTVIQLKIYLVLTIDYLPGRGAGR